MFMPYTLQPRRKTHSLGLRPTQPATPSPPASHTHRSFNLLAQLVLAPPPKHPTAHDTPHHNSDTPKTWGVKKDSQADRASDWRTIADHAVHSTDMTPHPR